MTTTDGVAPVFRWLAEPVGADVERSIRRLARTPDVVRVAIMPDAHLARDICIGTVVATRTRLLPDAVGGDIGCGMAAARLDVDAARLAEGRTAALVLSLLRRVLASGGRSGEIAELPEALARRALSAARLERRKHRVGRLQLGTLGRGNHFLELQSDGQGRLWLMVHTGSRGIGQAIREHHLEGAPRSPTGLRYLEAQSPAGQAYLSDVSWALEYAEHNRRRLVEQAAWCLQRVLGARLEWESYFTCHHNFVRSEVHEGEPRWIHRKGAISASPDEPGIIPGSMGTRSYHVRGRGHPDALCSSSHGAGRVMSRAEARHRIGRRALVRQMRGVWFDPRNADGLRDEAPGAYKDIRAVMRAQRELTRITRRLTPMLSYKAIGR